MGVTGVEGKCWYSTIQNVEANSLIFFVFFFSSGVYRRSSEITLKILRENKDSLMSVLETFLHDPLVEWKAPRGVSFVRKKSALYFRLLTKLLSFNSVIQL